MDVDRTTSDTMTLISNYRYTLFFSCSRFPIKCFCRLKKDCFLERFAFTAAELFWIDEMVNILFLRFTKSLQSLIMDFPGVRLEYEL